MTKGYRVTFDSGHRRRPQRVCGAPSRRAHAFCHGRHGPVFPRRARWPRDTCPGHHDHQGGGLWTSAASAEGLTRGEVRRTSEARRLQQMLGYPSNGDYNGMVRGHMLRDCSVATTDIANARAIYSLQPELRRLVGNVDGTSTTATQPPPRLCPLCSLLPNSFIISTIPIPMTGEQ